MIDLLQYEFMRNALIAGLLASVGCGVVGSYIVIKRAVFISDGVAHASFGGVGLGYLLGVNPVLGALAFAVISALGIGIVARRVGKREDTAIGILMAFGMAVGIIFIGLAPGYAPDLMSFLFGNILTVPRSDLVLMVVLDVVVVGFVIGFYKEFLAITFDEEFAEIAGVPVNRLYMLLLCLTALTVVMLMRIVGIILLVALLTIPAAISIQFTHRLSSIMLLSIGLAAGFSVGGLWVSYVFDIASGATIVVLSVIVFFVASLSRKIR